MSFTNDILLRTLQIIKREGKVEGKKFLMLGKQSMEIRGNFLGLLEESGLVDDIKKFGGGRS